MFRVYLNFIIALVVCGVASSPTVAVDICVTCDKPDVIYTCRTTAAPEHEVFLGNRRLLQLACIRRIAQTYGHGTCKSNQRNNQICTGQLISVDVSEMARRYTSRLPKPLRQELDDDNSSDRRLGPKQSAPAEGEPKTVVELAKRTAQNSQEQLDNAGDAVKNAGKAVQKQINKAGQVVKDAGKAVGDGAEQTWRCLSSFFQDC